MNLEAEFRFLYPNFLQNLFVTDFAAEVLGEKKKKKQSSEFGYGKKDLLVYLDFWDLASD